MEIIGAFSLGFFMDSERTSKREERVDTII